MKKLFLLVLILPHFIFAQWTQIGNDINGEGTGDFFGNSVSLNQIGDVVAIGSNLNNGINGGDSGSLRVFKNISNSWVQVGSDIDGEGANDWSGFSVSIDSSGDIVAVSAILNDGSNGNNSGHVRVFRNISDNWEQIGSDLDGLNSASFFGTSIKLSHDGNILAVGGTGVNSNGNENGYVKIYENISDVWTQIGADLNGNSNDNNFGESLDLNAGGNILAVGTPFNNNNGTDAGNVRVYENISGVWTQLGLAIDGENAGDWSGFRVSLNDTGNILAIGAMLNDDNGTDSGHVRVFENISGVWTQLGSDIDGENAGDNFGRALDLNSAGNILAVGERRNDNNGTDSGQASIYKYTSGEWVKFDASISGQSSGDNFGSSISINGNGNIIAAGAILNDTNGLDSGHTRIFNNDNILNTIEPDYTLEQIIYPNPVKSILNHPTYTNTSEVKIFNALGQQIMLTNSNYQYDLSNLASGIYTMHIYSKSEKLTVKHLIKY